MLLMGCQDKTVLFVELRKMTDPTIADLMAKAETMEQALRDCRSLADVIETRAPCSLCYAMIGLEDDIKYT
jgi:hypothetical protein